MLTAALSPIADHRTWLTVNVPPTPVHLSMDTPSLLTSPVAPAGAGPATATTAKPPASTASNERGTSPRSPAALHLTPRLAATAPATNNTSASYNYQTRLAPLGDTPASARPQQQGASAASTALGAAGRMHAATSAHSHTASPGSSPGGPVVSVRPRRGSIGTTPAAGRPGSALAGPPAAAPVKAAAAALILKRYQMPHHLGPAGVQARLAFIDVAEAVAQLEVLHTQEALEAALQAHVQCLTTLESIGVGVAQLPSYCSRLIRRLELAANVTVQHVLHSLVPAAESMASSAWSAAISRVSVVIKKIEAAYDTAGFSRSLDAAPGYFPVLQARAQYLIQQHQQGRRWAELVADAQLVDSINIPFSTTAELLATSGVSVESLAARKCRPLAWSHLLLILTMESGLFSRWFSSIAPLGVQDGSMVTWAHHLGVATRLAIKENFRPSSTTSGNPSCKLSTMAAALMALTSAHNSMAWGQDWREAVVSSRSELRPSSLNPIWQLAVCCSWLTSWLKSIVFTRLGYPAEQVKPSAVAARAALLADVEQMSSNLQYVIDAQLNLNPASPIVSARMETSSLDPALVPRLYSRYAIVLTDHDSRARKLVLQASGTLSTTRAVIVESIVAIVAQTCDIMLSRIPPKSYVKQSLTLGSPTPLSREAINWCSSVLGVTISSPIPACFLLPPTPAVLECAQGPLMGCLLGLSNLDAKSASKIIGKLSAALIASVTRMLLHHKGAVNYFGAIQVWTDLLFLVTWLYVPWSDDEEIHATNVAELLALVGTPSPVPPMRERMAFTDAGYRARLVLASVFDEGKALVKDGRPAGLMEAGLISKSALSDWADVRKIRSTKANSAFLAQAQSLASQGVDMWCVPVWHLVLQT